MLSKNVEESRQLFRSFLLLRDTSGLQDKLSYEYGARNQVRRASRVEQEM